MRRRWEGNTTYSPYYHTRTGASGISWESGQGGGFQAQLWQQASMTALRDHFRPKRARELMRDGALGNWFDMAWRDARALIDAKLIEEYRVKISELFLNDVEQGDTVPTVDNLC